MTRTQLETLGQALIDAFAEMRLPAERHLETQVVQSRYLPDHDHVAKFVWDSDGEAITSVKYLKHGDPRYFQDKSMSYAPAERRELAIRRVIRLTMAYHQEHSVPETAPRETPAASASQWV